LATTRGLEGLSIGELAQHIGMSKSGLYAHFKSKEELELATIETAAGIFERDVLGPARESPGGLGRVIALGEAFLRHLERRGVPGRLLLRQRLGATGLAPRAPARPGDGVDAEALARTVRRGVGSGRGRGRVAERHRDRPARLRDHRDAGPGELYLDRHRRHTR